MGAAVGSLIRPIGGTLSDKFGGARVTMVAIVVCSAAAIAQGIVLITINLNQQYTIDIDLL